VPSAKYPKIKTIKEGKANLTLRLSNQYRRKKILTNTSAGTERLRNVKKEKASLDKVGVTHANRSKRMAMILAKKRNLLNLDNPFKINLFYLL
jgi:hypothetical protein